jgi:hypothetical protein
VIFFLANVVRVVKHNRKVPRHLPHVSAGKLANVVESVVRRVAHDLKVEISSSEESVLRVRRGNVLQEESERRRVARELHERHERHERKGIVLYASRENGPLDPGELKALPRRLQSFKKPRRSLRPRYLQLRMFKRPRYLQLRMFKRPRYLQLRIFKRPRYLQCRMFKRPRYLKLRQHRHLHRAMALLRASRGDSKPCYWHRHDISIASNIAVA